MSQEFPVIPSESENGHPRTSSEHTTPVETPNTPGLSETNKGAKINDQL